jgi:hypothetical protein
MPRTKTATDNEGVTDPDSEAADGAGNGETGAEPGGQKQRFDLDEWVGSVLAEKFGPEVNTEAARVLLSALGDVRRPGSAEAIRAIQIWRRETKKHGSMLFGL